MLKQYIEKIKRGWLAFAKYLGWVNTIVLLTLVYWLVLAPIAIVIKIVKRDILLKKLDSSTPSYWQARQVSNNTLEEMKKQF